MNKNNPDHRVRAGNVISLNEQKPLLESLGYETLMGMITPEEIKEAEALLKQYLKSFPDDIEKKVVLAYLFGIMQGVDDMYKDKSLVSFAERLLRVHRMGQQLGMRLAFILFKQEEKNDAT